RVLRAHATVRFDCTVPEQASMPSAMNPRCRPSWPGSLGVKPPEAARAAVPSGQWLTAKAALERGGPAGGRPGFGRVSVLPREPAAPAARVRFQIPRPENTRLGSVIRLSPDGRKLAAWRFAWTIMANNVL